eukprot:4725036-Prymnesium_polylepis.1
MRKPCLVPCVKPYRKRAVHAYIPYTDEPVTFTSRRAGFVDCAEGASPAGGGRTRSRGRRVDRGRAPPNRGHHHPRAPKPPAAAGRRRQVASAAARWRAEDSTNAGWGRSPQQGRTFQSSAAGSCVSGGRPCSRSPGRSSGTRARSRAASASALAQGR